jgi:hypothetical protein
MPLRHSRRAFTLVVASWIAVSLPTRPSYAAQEQRAEAASLIPLHALNAEAKQKLSPILEHPTLFRRLPSQSMDCDPEMFTFIARQPEVLVSIWEAMGITKVQTERLGPYLLKGLDSAGTSCELELIYGTPAIHVFYAKGRYDGSIAPQGITGRGIFVLHSTHSKTASGRNLVSCNLDVFMQLDNLGADLIARTIQPLLWGTAEQNFVESTKYVSQISQAAELNPEGIQSLTHRLPSLSPTVRDQFLVQVQRVASRADHRWTSNSKP